MSDEQQTNADQQRGIKAYRFRKGQSGNPKGRPPKAKAIPDILARITAEDVPEPLLSKMRQMFRQMPDNPTILEAILRVVVSKAIKGEPWAVVFIAERMEGKVRDNLKIEGGQTLQIVEELVEAPGQVLEMTPDEETTPTITEQA